MLGERGSHPGQITVESLIHSFLYNKIRIILQMTRKKMPDRMSRKNVFTFLVEDFVGKEKPIWSAYESVRVLSQCLRYQAIPHHHHHVNTAHAHPENRTILLTPLPVRQVQRTLAGELWQITHNRDREWSGQLKFVTLRSQQPSYPEQNYAANKQYGVNSMSTVTESNLHLQYMFQHTYSSESVMYIRCSCPRKLILDMQYAGNI